TERRHQEAAGDSDHAERQDDQDLVKLKSLDEPEIKHDDDRDEAFENAEKLSLRSEVGLASLIDQLADFPHGVVHRHGAELAEDHQAEDEPKGADQETAHQQAGAGDASEERNRVQPRQFETGLAPWSF